MNHQTQGILTVLVSTLVFGVAGYWLLPNRTKGSIVAAAVGATASTGYVRQNKRIREVTHTLNSIETHLKHISQPDNIPGSKTKTQGQITLNVKEINRLRNKIEELNERIENSRKNQLDNDIGIQTENSEAKINSMVSEISILTKNSQDESINQDEDDIAADEDVQRIIDWFDSRDVSLENYYEPDHTIDNLLDGLSIYLGDNYSVLNQFHWRLRRSVGKTFRFNLDGYDSRAKSILNQYLKKLRSSDYLSSGRLVKRPDNSDFILASSHNRSDIQGFFDGGWFERFIYYKAVELLDSEGIDYQYIRGAKIIYPNNEYSELDLFFLIDKKPLLIECKSGQNHDEGISKFVQHRERLGLEVDEAIFVVLDIDEAAAYIRTRNWKITVTDQNSFLHVIQKLSSTPKENDDDTKSEVETEEQENNLVSTSTLEKDETVELFFKRRGLNLAPEYRSIVIEELINLFKTLHESMSFNDIAKTLRDKIKNKHSIGRNKIAETLNCLRYSDIFRNDKHKPVRNTSLQISSMSSMKIETLERKCMEIYASKILQQFDPDFFDTENNVAEFERLTLGKAPSSDKISKLK